MRRLTRRLGRAFVYTLGGLCLFVVLLAGAAWLLIPRLEQYKPQVESMLSGYLGQEIAMETLEVTRDGLNVAFRAGGVRVAVTDQPESGMRFGEIFVSVNSLHLLGGYRTFDRLELVGPTIEAARLSDGRIRVGDTIIGTPRGMVRRLLQGENLEVTDGTLIWRDALAVRTPEVRIQDVHVAIQPEGAHRRFAFTATAPEDLMMKFEGRGSYDPRSLDSRQWTASVDVSVRQANLSRIPAVIQERLPWKSRGHVDGDFHAEWADGDLTAAAADIEARDFVIPYSKNKTPLAARRFTSSVSWQRSKAEWRLVFDKPEIVIEDTPVSVTRFELERLDEQRIYSAQDANVEDLLGVVNRLEIEIPGEALIDQLHPRGVFSSASLTLSGPYLEATAWKFEGDFRNVGWRAQPRYPGIQGLDGHLVADGQRGQLSLSSNRLEVDAASTLNQPVGFDRVQAVVEWYRSDDDWVVDISDGLVGNDDLAVKDLSLHTRISPGAGTLPRVEARFDIDRADIPALRDYLPVRKLKPRQVEWLERAMVGGEITNGKFHLNGPLSELPYRTGNGELRVSARISGGVLDFNEKWPNLRDLEGIVELNNSRFEAVGERGAIMDSRIRNVRVRSEDFFQPDKTVYVDGTLDAQVDDVVQFLRRGPLIKNPPPAYRKMSGRGAGALNLEIELPFTRLKEASRVKGHYAFEGAAVEVAEGVEFTNVSGRVDFTDSTVGGSGLHGELWGGPVQADVVTLEPGRPMTFALIGTGEADVARLSPVVGPVLVSRLAGRAGWTGRFTGGPGANQLEVRTDLAGVEIDLPEPLWIPSSTENLLDVRVDFDGDDQRIFLNLYDRLNGELHYGRRDGRAVLVRGVLNSATDLPLPESELILGFKGENLNLDQWVEEINKLARRKETLDRTQPGRTGLFEHLRRVNIDASRFRYLRRNLGPVSAEAISEDGKRWTTIFVGSRLKGTGLMLFDTTPARYRFDFDRLHWPEREKIERAATYKRTPKPSDFAHISIGAEDFRYGDMRLGRLHFAAGPDEHVWRIRKLTLSQPDLNIEADGSWSSDQFGGQRTRLNASVEASHIGRALNQLGLKDQVAKGEAQVDGRLNWTGEPGDFRFATLGGNLSFTARDGRFLKLEPGSGRLLGLFNIESLARRMRLDFTDVFKEGLAFDRIDGKARITSGRLYTDGIFIIGPAALMELSGSTHLGEETYDLDVTVAPQLGANLSLAGALANPAAGAMIFVVQRLFKKQMARLINYKYRVTGDWANPEVEAVEQPASDIDGVGRN